MPRPAVLIIALAVAAAAAGFYRYALRAHPIELCKTSVVPDSTRYRAGHWYWVDHPSKSETRLVRDGKPIAAAQEIPGFDATDSVAVWSARDASGWGLWIMSPDSAPSKLLDRRSAPMGFAIADGALYWVETTPLISVNLPTPALAPHLNVYSLPIARRDGSQPALLASIPESDGAVVGVHDGTGYIVGRRSGGFGSMALYRVPIRGGTAVRVAADTGRGDAVVAEDGRLYWSAPSREASDYGLVNCVRSLDLRGQPETLTEWLPSPGAVVASGSDVRYVGGMPYPDVFPISQRGHLARPESTPDGFIITGSDNGQVLLTPKLRGAGAMDLYSMRMP